jgi:hypothetical protein
MCVTNLDLPISSDNRAHLMQLTPMYYFHFFHLYLLSLLLILSVYFIVSYLKILGLIFLTQLHMIVTLAQLRYYGHSFVTRGMDRHSQLLGNLSYALP